MIRVIGSGVGAAVCAWVLAGHRFSVELVVGTRGLDGGPTLFVDERACDLLEQVFGEFELHGHRIATRVLAWGWRRERSEHRGFVVRAGEVRREALRAARRSSLIDVVARRSAREAVAEVVASADVELTSFGSRCAVEATVEVDGPSDSVVLKQGHDGWAFLLPTGPGRGVLQVVTLDRCAGRDALEAMLDEVGFGNVRVLSVCDVMHPVAPAIATPLADVGWLRVAAAAFRMDPLSGSGVASSARSGLLAAATIASLGRASDPAAMLGHYERRIRSHVRAHLDACAELYSEATLADAWRAEIRCMATTLPHDSPFASINGKYRLNGTLVFSQA
jgi:hypothetical protein